jgi:hypothetical protein
MGEKTYTEVVYRDGTGKPRTIVLTHRDETADEQRARMQKGQPRTDDDEWERDESGVVRIVHRDRVTLIGPASLIVLRDGLKSLDEVQSVIVEDDGAMYEKVDVTAGGATGRQYIKGLRVDVETHE